jgi:hypothetical protein
MPLVHLLGIDRRLRALDRLRGRNLFGGLRRRQSLRVSLREDRLRGREIFFHVRRRQREHRPDPLEAMPLRVFEKRTGIGGIELHAEEIAHGVHILLAAQAIVGHRRARRHARGLAFLHLRGEPFHDARAVVCLRPFFRFLRRHLSGADPLHDFQPLRRVLDAHVRGEIVHAEITLLRRGIVAIVAVLLEEDFDVRIEPGSRRRLRSRREKQRAKKARGLYEESEDSVHSLSAMEPGGRPEDRPTRAGPRAHRARAILRRLRRGESLQAVSRDALGSAFRLDQHA